MRADRIEQWTRPAIRALKPYYKAPVSGEPLRLDQNTNLFGPNPALAKVQVPEADQYPSRDADALLAALAQHHGLTPAHFAAGNGSDEILDLITKAFGGPGRVLATLHPTYSLYPFYATLQEMEFIEARSIDELVEAKAEITILASPNNPTGQTVAPADVERLLEGGIVVVDEAYMEYAGLDGSWMADVDHHDNLLVMRTFSKAYGLAGARVGYIAGNPELVARLLLVKPPFNLNAWSEAVAIQALQEQAWVQGVVDETAVQRERLADGLKQRGFDITPSSAAGSVWARHSTDPSTISSGLKQHNILVRTFPGKPGLESHVRFGVGRAEHVNRLFEALDEVLA